MIQMLINLANWLWFNVLGYALIAVGVFFAIRLGVPQIRHFGRAIKTMKKAFRDQMVVIQVGHPIMLKEG